MPLLEADATIFVWVDDAWLPVAQRVWTENNEWVPPVTGVTFLAIQEWDPVP